MFYVSRTANLERNSNFYHTFYNMSDFVEVFKLFLKGWCTST